MDRTSEEKNPESKTSTFCLRSTKSIKGLYLLSREVLGSILPKKLKECKQNDPKAYWNILNTCNKPKKENDISLSSFKQHFETLNQVDVEHSGEDFNPEDLFDGSNEELNKDFTLEELKKVIKKLKNGKACGFDNLINEYLKNSPDYLLNAIVKLFNIILQTGIVPEDWCIGIIIPLYKNKGSVNEVKNYRGINLLSILGKLFTSAIDLRVGAFFKSATAASETPVGLGQEQVGFRHGYGPMYHAFTLHSIIDLFLQNHKRLFAGFVDYSTAFDKIDRSTLWRKLLHTGIKGRIMRVVYNIYSRAKSCIKKGQKLSDFFSSNVGVRQGENLSPLLFAIYINDFENHMKESYSGVSLINSEIARVVGFEVLDLYLKLFVLLYADDTIILAETAEELQLALTSLKDYCHQNFLKVNLTKTKVLIFSRGKLKNIPDFFYGDEKVEVVDDYVYLGVVFNYNGSFTKAIEKQVSQAKK